MTKLSVNINKIAVVRNSRGRNLPDVVRAALDIERFGAEGITVHPRPDARHIRYDDVRNLNGSSPPNSISRAIRFRASSIWCWRSCRRR